MYLFFGYALMYGDVAEGAWIPGFGMGIGEENTAADVLASGEDTYYCTFGLLLPGRLRGYGHVHCVRRSGRAHEALGFPGLCGGDDWLHLPDPRGLELGRGALAAAGYFDFAGSGTVHMCGAAAALAGVLVLGPRAGKYGEDGSSRAIPGANMPLATLGTFILWFGWFGFNGGSELKLSNVDEANAVAQVFVNTNLAACGGVVAALLTARALFGKADLTMALNGALAGLVSITADPLSPSAELSVLVGLIGGVLVVFSIIGLDRLKIDDPVGAISVHGVVGIWGVLAVLLSNGDASFGGQALGIVAIFGWTFGASLVIWSILKATMGIRVSQEEEYEGTDISECGLEAYPEFTKS